MFRVASAISFVMFLSSAATAQTGSISPSFDCKKASGSAEEAICQTDSLAQMDNELARLYKLALHGPQIAADATNELKAMQRGWIKGRDDCWKSDLGLEACVASEYGFRIHDLRQGYADARSDDKAGISLGPLAMICDGLQAGISVVYVNGSAPSVTLKWLDQAIWMPQAPSGSGARYATDMWWQGPTELWIKGDEAMFTPPGGTEMPCRFEEIG